MTIRQSGPKDIQDSIERNNLKLSADKILQGLMKVRNAPSKSRRRWVWELVQNAKDVPNVFDRVRIRVELTKEKLVFMHNGDPFTIDNILGLIQQVSTKDSGGEDPEQTGKFGTGFISTHLLSEHITVEGVTIRPGGTAKRFTIELDRSGRRAEELMPHIEEAMERIKVIDSDPAFVSLNAYDKNRSKEDLDTKLTYRFQGKEGPVAANVGLEDLRNTLPFTLANVPKIEEVIVVDTVRNTEISYRCEVVKEEGEVRSMSVAVEENGEEEYVHFLCREGDGITLMVQVGDPEALDLLPNFGEQPSLYRQFPLIGSEKFHWPFVLNGEEFMPTEERDGVLLNSEEDVDHLANREILERAMDEAMEFSEWLIANGATNRYVIAYTRVPDIYWEPDARKWYSALQSDWRKRIRELPLVENHAGEPAILKDAFIPKFGASKEVREAFWELYAPFVGYAMVPRKDLLHEWIAALGPEDELATWGDDYSLCFDLEDLLSRVQDAKGFKDLELSSLPGQPVRDTSAWLRDILQFAIDQGEIELLNEYAVVPDLEGVFHKLEDLYEEPAEDRIPNEVLDVMARLGLNWRSEIVHRDMQLKGLSHQRRSISDASQALNEMLQKEKKNGQGQLIEHFLFRDDARDILFELLSIVPPGTKSSFRMDLLRSAGPLLGYEVEFNKVEGCAKLDFSPAIRLLIETMHDELEELGTMAKLMERLEVDEEDAIQWMDDHLRRVNGNAEFKQWMEYGNVIPTRSGVLKAYDEVFNYGTEETPLHDQLLSVLSALDEEEDWTNELLADGIGIRTPQSKTMADLGNAIQECVKQLRADMAQNEGDLVDHRTALLALINWCEENEEDARKYLGGFLPSKDSLFFQLVVRGNIGTGVINMLADPTVVALLQSIEKSDLDMDKVGELLALGAALGSLDEMISSAKEMLEEKQDFEYKKELGERMEQMLKKTLDAEGFQTHVQGIGAYDISVKNPANGKVFYIELKSTSHGSTDAMKLAPVQAMAWTTDVANRALCLIERGAKGSNVTIDYIKQHLRTRNALAHDLAEGNAAYNKFIEVKNGQRLDIQLLSDVRVRLERDRFMQGAGDYTMLISAIRKAIG